MNPLQDKGGERALNNTRHGRPSYPILRVDRRRYHVCSRPRRTRTLSHSRLVDCFDSTRYERLIDNLSNAVLTRHENARTESVQAFKQILAVPLGFAYCTTAILPTASRLVASCLLYLRQCCNRADIMRIKLD